ncbi:MAG TPA: hypothetical protein PLG59_06795 [bacterium]|nr:hypothetical protein [bacterium]HQO34350.1 hypothetical protein [bacterium]HQP97893.1 hypothetical protein [bacterium]
MGDKKDKSKDSAPTQDAAPEKPVNGSAPEEDSYADAMQARIDRLASQAKNTHRRSFYTTLITFFVLCFIAAGALFLLKNCKGGQRFKEAFGWQKRRY